MNHGWLRQSDPGIANICIDQIADGNIAGRIYHKYTKEAVEFSNAWVLCKELNQFFDSIDYPQSSVKLADGFVKKEMDTEYSKSACQELRSHPLCKAEEVLEKRGQKTTVAFRITSRLHASWQGEVNFLEKGEEYSFRSMLEFLQIMNNKLGL